MGTTYELTAAVRDKVGKGAARSTRRQGMIPAVIYGGKEPPVAITLPDREVYFKIHGGGFFTTVATIDVAGKKIRAIPRDYQLDPVSERPVHVDFMRVVPGSKLTIEVPVQFINEAGSPGIRRGGVLNVVRHRIAVVCPAESIPERIVADLTGLDINDSLHISAVSLPEGVRPSDHRTRLHHRHDRGTGRRQGRDEGGRRSRCRRQGCRGSCRRSRRGRWRGRRRGQGRPGCRSGQGRRQAEGKKE